jgi:hypothetical protein
MQFRAVEQHVGGQQFHRSDEVEMTDCEWLQTHEPNFHHNVSFKKMLSLGKCINALVAYTEK